MLEYKDDVLYVECDFCGENVYLEGSWKQCMGQLKNEKWISMKKNGIWFNFCSEACKKEVLDSEEYNDIVE